MEAIEKEARVNEKIRVPEVRVVDSSGVLLGVMPTGEALALATSQNLDLVEVAPGSRPPVCRVMDYGRFKYEQSKRGRKARKKQHTAHVKEVRLRPKIDDHDYSFKIRHARKFLEHRDKVKVTLFFRGREIAYRERGEKLLQRMAEDLADIATVEVTPRMEGRHLVQVLAPRPTGGGPRKKSQEKTAGTEAAGQAASGPSKEQDPGEKKT